MANRTKGPGKGRFKPGVCANPKGRPKGIVSSIVGGEAAKKLKDAIESLVTEPFEDAKASFGANPTGAQKLALAWMESALAGDGKAISSLAERVMGKVPQPVVGGGEDDAPVKFTLDIGQGKA